MLLAWTSNEIKFLKSHYPESDWDYILQALPYAKDTIIHKASELNIRRTRDVWSDDELALLVDSYSKHLPTKRIAELLGGRHNCAAICTKANKMGLKTRRKWSDEEISILKEYYSSKPSEEVLEMLPGRSLRTIQCKARSLGLHAYAYLERAWSQFEDEAIRKYWISMNDIELAEMLGRSRGATKFRRQKLGLYRPVPVGTYEYLRKYLWKENRLWRKRSIEACGYRCIVTGERFQAVHHLHSSNLIVNEVLDVLDLEYDKVGNYSPEQLNLISKTYADLNLKYPLGVCLSERIHKQFHNEYGYGNNTPDQFQEFLSKYYPETQIPVTIKVA